MWSSFLFHLRFYPWRGTSSALWSRVDVLVMGGMVGPCPEESCPAGKKSHFWQENPSFGPWETGHPNNGE